MDEVEEVDPNALVVDADGGRMSTYVSRRDARLSSIVVLPSGMPVTSFTFLATDEDVAMRVAVASDPRCPPEVLASMIEDRDLDVLGALAVSPNLPLDSLRALSRNAWVRRVASDSYVGRVLPQLTPEQVRAYDAVMCLQGMVSTQGPQVLDLVLERSGQMDAQAWNLFVDLLTSATRLSEVPELADLASDVLATPADTAIPADPVKPMRVPRPARPGQPPARLQG